MKYRNCVAAIGAMHFSVRGFGCALFYFMEESIIMKFKKMTAVTLAAVLVCGSISTVSFAEEKEEIREESKYEITLDKETVDGEEKAAVTFSGLPKEAFTFEYAHSDEKKIGEENGINIIRVSGLGFNGVRVMKTLI